MKKSMVVFLVGSMVLLVGCITRGDGAPALDHAWSSDFPIMSEAYQYGFKNNRVTDTVDGRDYPLINIQSVNSGVPVTDFNEKRFFSCWTRDVFWGSLGYTLVGDQEVTNRMKTTIELMLLAKAKNQADGTNKHWPCDNGRYYIPQAFNNGAIPSYDFIPYNAESQAHFILIVHLYWKSTGDASFVRDIWDEVSYVMETVRLMDTNGNGLPDYIWGSYDYQGVGPYSEESLMCATAAAAYRAFAEMADAIGKPQAASDARERAETIRVEMNKPVEAGGLWKETAEGGYYVNYRNIAPRKEEVVDTFIPYQNLVPVFFGVVPPERIEAIFARLDRDFNTYYLRKHGPMYVATTAGVNERTVEDCSTAPWLGFLDVYLRSTLGVGDPLNRKRIFSLLLAHAYDVAGVPFAEGLGIFGDLTGGAGRQWDNGNFFHCLVSGIYGIKQNKDGLFISPPSPIEGFCFSRLDDLRWRDAIYTIHWQGEGDTIASVTLDGRKVSPADADGTVYQLTKPTGQHSVIVKLK